jgi:hypothetical protein
LLVFAGKAIKMSDLLNLASEPFGDIIACLNTVNGLHFGFVAI